MILFDKNNNCVDVYNFEYLIDDMISFKEQEMKKLDKRDIFLSGVVNSKLPNDNGKYDTLYLPVGDDLYKIFNIIRGQMKEYRVDQMLNLYYRGTFDKLNTITTGDLNKLKYYLFDLNKPEKYRDKDIISNIIQVPETLYYLQLLLNERFDKIKDKNIDSILDLFKLDKIEEIDINNIHGSHGYIRKGNLEQVLKKASDDEFIIKKLTR